ncbi:FkbM family methyltransferase [Pengzhenrongella frigida]|uniref:FkbM family methyltransferase n=1 Tax=Pengzhenrongella frigida TaxID=1259133 RepID=A0A4Q5N3X7_9MICO|nr:FkbM family methyltransferase [Cellulomonas sp. HLT2-17]RYV51347.1 FkbM family methyltransferase [Cellulomonas sp. HLT2-17]
MTNSAQFISYSQHGEDVILWRALGERPAGFYVDVGAFDPSYDSVTRALYERGWRGINIEPQPERLEAFERERPEDSNLSLAVGDRDGVATLTLPDNPGWASLLAPAVTGSDAMGFRTLEVPIRRLDTLLAERGVDRVDILKIDVEGAEPAVVRGLLDGPIRPLICVVEGVAPGIGRTAGDEAVGLLVEAGYVHCLFDGLNHYLTVDPELESALSVPANPLDGYQTDLVDRLLRERHDLQSTIASLAGENLVLRAVHAAPPVPIPEADLELDGPATREDVGPEDHVPADEVPAKPEGSDLPLPAPADGDADVRVEPGPLPPEPDTSALTFDPETRAARRRISFSRLLQGAPAALPRPPAPALDRLLQLALGDRAPADAVLVLYQEILGRTADSEGLAAWTNRLEAGRSLLEVAHELADSDEALTLPEERIARVRSDLIAWESLIALNELGIAAWHPGRTYTRGTVSHEIFIEALYEVALQRRPTPDEVQFEVNKLVGGVGREWLIRAYAANPAVKSRLLGEPTGALRGRLSQWRTGRRHLETFRALVTEAEARQVAQILGDLPRSTRIALER